MADTKLELPDVQEVEVGSGIDLSEFEGNKKKITHYEVMDGKSPWGEDGELLPAGQTRDVKLLKVITEQITEFDRDGEKIPVYASELFNLKQDGDIWGISTHEKAKIQRLMKKLKVTSIRDIIGKAVTIRVRETEKGGTFLGFYVD